MFYKLWGKFILVNKISWLKNWKVLQFAPPHVWLFCEHFFHFEDSYSAVRFSWIASVFYVLLRLYDIHWKENKFSYHVINAHNQCSNYRRTGGIPPLLRLWTPMSYMASTRRSRRYRSLGVVPPPSAFFLSSTTAHNVCEIPVDF